MHALPVGGHLELIPGPQGAGKGGEIWAGGGLGVPLSLPCPLPLCPLVLSPASCGAGQPRGRGVPDKGALETPHGLINATCLSLGGLRGLLIIFIKKIISPNQGRSSPELQLIKRSHIFLFYKKSCGADENYRPLEAA